MKGVHSLSLNGKWQSLIPSSSSADARLHSALTSATHCSLLWYSKSTVSPSQWMLPPEEPVPSMKSPVMQSELINSSVYVSHESGSGLSEQSAVMCMHSTMPLALLPLALLVVLPLAPPVVSPLVSQDPTGHSLHKEPSFGPEQQQPYSMSLHVRLCDVRLVSQVPTPSLQNEGGGVQVLLLGGGVVVPLVSPVPLLLALVPQSAQSVPRAQYEYAEPAPPSSQIPSLILIDWHELLQSSSQGASEQYVFPAESVQE